MFIGAGGEYWWVMKINFVGKVGLEMALQTTELGLDWCCFRSFSRFLCVCPTYK